MVLTFCLGLLSLLGLGLSWDSFFDLSLVCPLWPLMSPHLVFLGFVWVSVFALFSLLVSLWGSLRLSWVVLVSLWGSVGLTWPLLASLGLSWASLGRLLASLGRLLVSLGSYFASSKAISFGKQKLRILPCFFQLFELLGPLSEGLLGLSWPLLGFLLAPLAFFWPPFGAKMPPR